MGCPFLQNIPLINARDGAVLVYFCANIISFFLLRISSLMNPAKKVRMGWDEISCFGTRLLFFVYVGSIH